MGTLVWKCIYLIVDNIRCDLTLIDDVWGSESEHQRLNNKIDGELLNVGQTAGFSCSGGYFGLDSTYTCVK